MRFRKKPVEIDAVQFTGENKDACLAFMRETQCVTDLDVGPFLIATLEGDMTASPGDWIIRGVAGEYYPCKPDIFDLTYEPVED